MSIYFSTNRYWSFTDTSISVDICRYVWISVDLCPYLSICVDICRDETLHMQEKIHIYFLHKKYVPFSQVLFLFCYSMQKQVLHAGHFIVFLYTYSLFAVQLPLFGCRIAMFMPVIVVFVFFFFSSFF